MTTVSPVMAVLEDAASHRHAPDRASGGRPAHARPGAGLDVGRLSARFGIAFTVCQLVVMVCMAVFVLPHGGSPDDPALERGTNVLDAETAYRTGNYVFMISGSLLLGFLGVVHLRLRRVDGTGVLAAVAVAAGTLLALIWPFAGVLHDIALETAATGSDVRILAGWDSAAPFALAFSALPRVFFVGAILLGLGAEGVAPWLRRTGVALLPVSLVGSATLLVGDLFPLLALSTLGFELWLGALAWHWLRQGRDQ
ncbi:hypothetical protein MXD62_24730 [Frankia sp. Mgl5]|uniref:hypothetical protein n=1 Tax=Frankia sp. Mgl5 TaxID=2933793 RepID=UPI0020100145|nr:hypothetical protein [Frankia sp. Mgl5]MCK9930329.1 hypothetical protein [Frankia sp. Mgl5]